MTSKRDTARKVSTRQNDKLQNDKALSRRKFFAGGAAGVSAAVLSGSASAQETTNGIVWNYEADVVILGSGCVGLACRRQGARPGRSVIVIDQNFDVGGKLVHSGGWTSLGGGDAIQERDRTGADPRAAWADGAAAQAGRSGRRSRPPVPDMTDWSVVDATGVARYRYNDRELHRAWADNAPKTRQFMMDNYIRFARIDGTHQGGGMSRGRAARRDHEDRRQDRHQGGHDVARGPRRSAKPSGIRCSIRCASTPGVPAD